MTQVMISKPDQDTIDRATEDMEWSCYSRWQDFGDIAKQKALQNYLKLPKVTIDDLADVFDRDAIDRFPWDDTAIEIEAPHGITVRVEVDKTDPFDNGQWSYDDTIGTGNIDRDGYLPMVFKIHTTYTVKSEDGKDCAGGESDQIQFISDRSICETIDTLTGDMAEMARDIYTRAMETYVNDKGNLKVETLGE